MTRIISTAPQPSWCDLVTLAGRAESKDAILTPWLRAGDEPFLFSRAAWALRAAVEAMDLDRMATVWLPDYFCNEATLLLREIARLVFYPIAETMQPDWTVCRSLASLTPPDAFLFVHFFGYPLDAAPARDFCDKQKAILIEDAAHAPAIGETQIGVWGDATIWSLYKHLPIPDGGLLTVRFGKGLAPARAAEFGRKFGSRSQPMAIWYAKRIAQRLAPWMIGRLRAAPLPFAADPAADLPMRTPAISAHSIKLLNRWAPAIHDLARRRRENAAMVYRVFESARGLKPLWADHDAPWAPYRAVFRAETQSDADSWYRRLRASGNEVETWPDLSPEVRANADEHSVALSLRNTVLMLPIHVDKTPGQLASAYRQAL